MSEFGRCGSRKYYLRYTILFFILAGISLAWFVVCRRSLVWSADGITQHYNALAYYGKYLREIFRNLWKQHRLIIPAYDFSIGCGADVLASLNYYVIGDPLNLLSVFVPAEYSEYLYDALVVLRMYLAGLAFSAFARRSISAYLPEYPKAGQSAVVDDGVLLGSVTYLFSEYVLYFFCRHPFFLTPMICLPLLLMGVDRIYEGKRGTLYAAAIALAAVCNFYFFYMLGIITVIYAVFRYFSWHSFSIRRIGGFLFRFCLFTLLGMGIAAVVLYPSVMSVFGINRLAVETNVPLFYELKYYIRLFSGFISIDNPGFQTFFGYPAVAFLAIILLFGQKKRYLLKGGFLLLTFFLLVPFFGHMFNGFSYVTNRWMFAYTMLIAWSVVRIYPLLIQDLPLRARWILLIFTGLECLVCAAGIAAKYLVGAQTNMLPIGYDLLVLVVLTILVCFLPSSKKMTRLFSLVVMMLTVSSVVCNTLDLRLWREDTIKFEEAGTAYSALADSPSSFLTEYKDKKSAWRYGAEETGEKINSALQTGLYGTSFYFSVANPYISEFRTALYLNELLDRCYRGMDSRGILEMVSGVKYCVAPADRPAPVGYIRSREFTHEGEQYAVFAREGEAPLPFLLGYDRVISRKAFDRLSVEQRQQILLDAMVCEDTDGLPKFCTKKAAKVPKVKLSPTQIVCGKNCSLKGKILHVKKAGAKVVLESSTDQAGEVYVVMEGVRYQEKSSGVGKLLSGSMSSSIDKLKIKVIQGQLKRNIEIIRRKGGESSSTRNSFVCNLGVQPAGSKKITLKFPDAGKYRFADLRISLQPTAKIAQRAAKWNEGISGTLAVQGDRVKADLTLDRKRLVCLAIPYDRGWSLEVDGQPEKIIRGNIMYCAVPLKAGRHTLRMRYRNPYVLQGAAVSALSMLIFALYLWRGAKKSEEG